MCGKITQMLSWRQIVELSDLQASIRPDGIETVTPMRFATVIARDDDGRRRAVQMRWGLTLKDCQPLIHARAETLEEKPAFRDAFARRRAILPVTTFNEGREVTPTRTEQYVLTPDDGAAIGIAVVWERAQEPQGGSLLTFAMVTVPPNQLIGTITDRMPALIDAADWPLWLGEVPATPAAVKALLQPSARKLTMQCAGKPPKKDPQPRLF